MATPAPDRHPTSRLPFGVLRHRARTLALQILFEVEETDHKLGPVLERYAADGQFAPDAGSFARHLCEGSWQERSYLDGIIEESAPNWPVAQMPAVDKTILRIALFELLLDDRERTPIRAVINEAVELAKQFGSDNSSRFINGVLGSVVARYRPDQADTSNDSA
jgi:N utilization substance protein B